MVDSHRNDLGLIDLEKLGRLDRVAEGVSMVHGFANVGFVYGRGGVMIVDTSSPFMAERALEGVRTETNEPIRHIVYTHGHVDHAGGASLFIGDAGARGHRRPEIWAHENVIRRFERYRLTWAWNNEVNRRQFAMPPGSTVFPERFVPPSRTYRDAVEIQLEREPIELHHAEGETDDATWVWVPERRVALVGDLLIQSMPNTGNPNKPQRNTLGWAEALEAIAAKRPEHVIPGHGDPVSGDYALEVLVETARALRHLHDMVIDALNSGLWPDDVVDLGIELPEDLAIKPYLAPIYGCAQFVIRDVLRRYAGWWGGDPAGLLPAPQQVVAKDLFDLIGKAALVGRARNLCAKGEARRALHLASVLHKALPEDTEGKELLADVLDQLSEGESSFIARNLYGALARRAREG